MAATARPSLTLGGAIGHVSSVLGGSGLVPLRLTRPFLSPEWCAWPNAACLPVNNARIVLRPRLEDQETVSVAVTPAARSLSTWAWTAAGASV
jgi:hypothetical protein